MAQAARRADIEFATYLQRIGRFPLLDAADELRLAKRWRDQGDQAAADRLVTAHLRLVVKIARSFRGYGIPTSEAIAEGNVGLLRAMKRFDPEKGSRFSTYATFWIKAAILSHVLNSQSLVKMGTTPAQRKLFFKLRTTKAQLSALEHGDLHPDHVITIAERLGVRETDVISMNRRIAGDGSLNSPTEQAVDAEEWQDRLVDETIGPEEELVGRQERELRTKALAHGLNSLTDRERLVVEARFLRDDRPKLEELGVQLGISRERVRQVEVKALNKLGRAVKSHVSVMKQGSTRSSAMHEAHT